MKCRQEVTLKRKQRDEPIPKPGPLGNNRFPWEDEIVLVCENIKYSGEKKQHIASGGTDTFKAPRTHCKKNGQIWTKGVGSVANERGRDSGKCRIKHQA